MFPTLSFFLKFVNGSFKLSLGLDQIYTLTTVKSGNHGSYPDPPAPKPFPLPYFDDFEGKHSVLSLLKICSAHFA